VLLNGRRQTLPLEKQVWGYDASFSSFDAYAFAVDDVFEWFKCLHEPVALALRKNLDFVFSFVESYVLVHLNFPPFILFDVDKI
jgi:hypothetical protein